MIKQSDVAQWHRREFPECSPERLTLKLAEESGETAKALESYVYSDGTSEDVEREAGDVVIVLLALCDRLGLDLETCALERWRTVRNRTYEA